MSGSNPAQAFADLRRELGPLISQHRDIGIKVGSLKVFAEALDDVFSILPSKRVGREGLSQVTFSGVPVVEHPALPDNMIAILDGPNIINIIKLGERAQ